jgi:hypothetical protein
MSGNPAARRDLTARASSVSDRSQAVRAENPDLPVIVTIFSQASAEFSVAAAAIIE